VANTQTQDHSLDNLDSCSTLAEISARVEQLSSGAQQNSGPYYTFKARVVLLA